MSSVRLVALRSAQAFAVALMLLTRLPVPARWQPVDFDAELQSRSVLFYPLVGAWMGTLLALVAWVLVAILPDLVAAALVVAFWLWLTGALHLDGLADTADALAAAHKDPARLQLAMKDPHLGTVGASLVVMVLISKVALVAAVLEAELAGAALPITLATARLAGQLYMIYTPYVRKDGLASQMQLGALKPVSLATLVLVLVLAALAFGWGAALGLTALLGGWLIYWRRRWLGLMGGYSGDCVGALIEVSEVLALLVLVASV